MLQSACSNIFVQVEELGRERVEQRLLVAPPAAPASAACRRTSPSGRSAPTRTSSRRPPVAVRCRGSTNDEHADQTPATPTKTRTGSAMGVHACSLSDRAVSQLADVVSSDPASAVVRPLSADASRQCVSVAHQHAFLEHIRRQLDALRLQPVDERRPHAGRLELAVGPAVLVDAELLVTGRSPA